MRQRNRQPVVRIALFVSYIQYAHINQISQNTTPVVSLADAKSHLRVDDTNSDTYISALVERATGLIEAESNIDLRATTWLWTGDFPHPRWHNGFGSPYHGHDFIDGYYRGFRHKIFLSRAPLQSVESIYYYDANDTLTEFTSGQLVCNEVPKVLRMDTTGVVLARHLRLFPSRCCANNFHKRIFHSPRTCHSMYFAGGGIVV